MVLKLFSSFDMKSFFNLKYSLFMVLIFFNSYFFLSKFISFLLSLSKTILKSFKYKFHFSLVKTTIMSLFLLMFLLNGTGLTPYVCSVTSHFFMIFGVSFAFWFSMVMSSLILFPLKFFTKFSPSGSPLLLVPLLKFIEVVSVLIRPMTLSLRLSINMTTGHMFTSLIAFYISFAMVNPLFLLLGIFILIWTFVELAAGLIQSYVFTMLLTQYLSEHS